MTFLSVSSPVLSTAHVDGAVSIASHPACAILTYRSLAFVSADAEITKTRPVWVVVPLPAPRQVVDLIVVPSSG